ncbi:hypothetical protein [Microcystis phage Mae-JY29]
MTLIEQLNSVRTSKQNRIALLEAGEMSTVLYGIDVTEGTLAEEREELVLIENLLQALGSKDEA